MSDESEIKLAETQAENPTGQPDYGVVLQILERKINLLRQIERRPISDRELKDCVNAVKTLKRRKISQ